MFLYPDIDPEILNIAAQKEKELATAEKNMRNEEDKVNKKKK